MVSNAIAHTVTRAVRAEPTTTRSSILVIPPSQWLAHAGAAAYVGSCLPACSATMYSAYQSGQFTSYWPPVRFSCSPCAAPARRSAAASSAGRGECRVARVHASGQSRGDLLQQPAVAVRIAECGEGGVAAPLRIATADGGFPGRRGGTLRSRRHRDRRARRAPPRCRTRRDRVRLPSLATADVIPVPKWIEQGEPGGVNCTPRNVSPAMKSASSLQPRPP